MDEAADGLCTSAVVIFAYMSRLYTLLCPACTAFDPCPLLATSHCLQGNQANMDEAADGLCTTAVAVIAYAARLYPRLALPFEQGSLTLLKEFLPAARAIGHNELLVVSQLCGLPADKYQVTEGEKP